MTRFILFLFIYLATLITPQLSFAVGNVVAFDAVGPSSAGTSTTGTTLSWSHTCSGTNRLLIVSVLMGDNPDTPTFTVTYNGISMTSIGLVHSNNQTAGYVQMFYLVAPPTGANTVQVTVAGGLPYSVVGGSVSFSGVNQATPYRNLTTSAGAGTAASVVVASATNNMVVDAIANGANITSSGKTVRWLKNDNGSSAAGNGAQSTSAGGASVTMSYVLSSDWYAMMAIDLIAATPGKVKHKVISF